VKTLRLDFIKCIIPKSRTFKHVLALLPDAYLATKIPDMSGKNLTDGNPMLDCRMPGQIVEVCTNITLEVMFKLHGDKLHFPRSAALLVNNFAM